MTKNQKHERNFKIMTIHEYLKEKRIECKLTQEKLAEKMKVTRNTIQNWEKKTLPDKLYWEDLIKVLNLSKEKFMKLYGDNAVSELPKQVDYKPNIFPDFLFPEQYLKKIKNLILTEGEQELLGLKEIYKSDISYEDSKFTFNNELAILPYDFIKKHNPFNVINLDDSLYDKLKGFDKNIIIQCILDNPNEVFDINKCSPKHLLKICSSFEISHFDFYFSKDEIIKKITSYFDWKNLQGWRYNDYPWRTWEEFINHTIITLKQIDNHNGKFIIAQRTPKYKEYNDTWDNGSWEFDEHFETYIKELYFDYIDYKEEIISKKEYPLKISVGYIEMTEKGKKLFNWYKENLPDDFNYWTNSLTKDDLVTNSQ